jgi:hypothetical protein
MQQWPIGLALDNPSSRRHHYPATLRDRFERLSLALAEARFALTRKNLRHIHAGDTHNFFVQVDELPMKQHREESARRRLPAPGWAYEYNTLNYLRFHASIVAFPVSQSNYAPLAGFMGGV